MQKPTNWTKNELKAYILIFLMNADIKELKEEIDFIKNKVGEKTYNEIYLEFNQDNDHQSIEKIRHAYNTLDYSKKETTAFFKEMEEFLIADNNEHIIETSILNGLKKILQ